MARAVTEGARVVSPGEAERCLRRHVVIGQFGDQTERMRGIVLLPSFQDPGPRAAAAAALQLRPPTRAPETRFAVRRLAGRGRDPPAGGGRNATVGFALTTAERTSADEKAGRPALLAGELQSPPRH